VSVLVCACSVPLETQGKLFLGIIYVSISYCMLKLVQKCGE